jgi:lysophospholipase L1-like esterase
MKLPRLALSLLVALTASWVSGQSTKPASSSGDPTVGTIKKNNPRFLQMHESFLARAKAGPIGLLFLGDSITEGWSTKAPDVWKKHYERYQPANFGIGGDRTEHVIWRIENGELEGIHPRVVVLLIGTNNSASNSAEEIAAANTKIIEIVRAKLPEAKVLLLAIFPRGPRKNADGTLDDGVKRMAVITEVNRRLAQLDDKDRIRFLDIGDKFLGPDGKIPTAIMPDQLHPNEAGYEIWAQAMQPVLEQMLR